MYLILNFQHFMEGISCSLAFCSIPQHVTNNLLIFCFTNISCWVTNVMAYVCCTLGSFGSSSHFPPPLLSPANLNQSFAGSSISLSVAEANSLFFLTASVTQKTQYNVNIVNKREIVVLHHEKTRFREFLGLYCHKTQVEA